MIRKIAVPLLISATLVSAPAHAQLSKLSNLVGGKSDTAAPAATAPDEAAQDALVRQFVAAQSPALNAQGYFAKAFGLAEQAQLIEAEKKAISGGQVDTGQLKKTVEASEAVQRMIDEKVASGQPLSAESKQHYAAGLIALVEAAVQARKLGESATAFTTGLKSLNPMQAASAATKLKAGAWVAKSSPSYIKSLYSSTKSALTYAKANNIQVPKNADALDF